MEAMFQLVYMIPAKSSLIRTQQKQKIVLK